MNQPQDPELEGFIHQKLLNLPDREAPDDLARSVLRAIADRERLPWWRQPFTEWPQRTQGALYFALAVLLAGVVWIIWTPAEQLTLSALLARAQSFSWLADASDALFRSVSLFARNVGWMTLAVAGMIFAMTYASCLVTGLALWRVTHPRQLS